MAHQYKLFAYVDSQGPLSIQLIRLYQQLPPEHQANIALIEYADVAYSGQPMPDYLYYKENMPVIVRNEANPEPYVQQQAIDLMQAYLQRVAAPRPSGAARPPANNGALQAHNGATQAHNGQFASMDMPRSNDVVVSNQYAVVGSSGDGAYASAVTNDLYQSYMPAFHAGKSGKVSQADMAKFQSQRDQTKLRAPNR